MAPAERLRGGAEGPGDPRLTMQGTVSALCAPAAMLACTNVSASSPGTDESSGMLSKYQSKSWLAAFSCPAAAS